MALGGSVVHVHYTSLTVPDSHFYLWTSDKTISKGLNCLAGLVEKDTLSTKLIFSTTNV